MSETSVVFYFQVHQPFRLRRYTFFDVGVDSRWFDDAENERIVRRVADRCYVPVGDLLLRAVERTGGRFRCAFSASGTALDQMEAWAPDALDRFVRLARTGCVEFLCETSHHSLAFLADEAEFRAQVAAQADRVERLFGRRPTTFRNTELVVDEHVASVAQDMGFEAVLGEGADHLLAGRSPCRVYGVRGCDRVRLLLRHYPLSDDVAFRFSNRGWPGWPLLAPKFAADLAAVQEPFVGLFMDYETFGEHQWKETGILDFLDALPEAVLAHPHLAFRTPAEVARVHGGGERLSIPYPVSWADAERDLTAWLGNPMQREANLALYALKGAVVRSGREDLLAGWRRLSTSDHLYYMCTKWFADGAVHKHFSPYSSPHDAFIAFMNVLDDLERRAAAAAPSTAPSAPPEAPARGPARRPSRPRRKARAAVRPAARRTARKKAARTKASPAAAKAPKARRTARGNRRPRRRGR